jgi:hypothetical protein
MSAILLETGSKLDFSVPAVMPRGGNTSRALPARFLFLLAPPLHGFADLAGNSNHKEWRFFGDRGGPWTEFGFSIETLVAFDTKRT